MGLDKLEQFSLSVMRYYVTRAMVLYATWIVYNMLVVSSKLHNVGLF